jgi:hypothetical protein
MIECLEYAREDEYPWGTQTFWTGIVDGHPECNGSAERQDRMRGYVLFAYNRDHPDAEVTAEDLHWTELTDRPEWT